jgi:hypothetical protein
MAGKSALRFAAVGGVLLSLAMFSSAALACKGPTTLFRDDFTDEDPAWGISDPATAQIGGGALKVTSEPGKFFNLLYQGMNFPSGDACIDVVLPATPVKSVTQGGLGIWTGRGWDFIYIQSDGQAGVQGLQGNDWINPVPLRKFDAIKTAPGSVNTLRVVWKAPPQQNATTPPDPYAQIFINDKSFIKYKTVQNANRAISIYADTEGSQYQFKNLAITQD